MFIDSHCHLNYSELVDEQADVIARAHAAGVSAMLNISTREGEWVDVVRTARAYDGIWASVGIHPHEADDHAYLDQERLIAATSDEKVVAIGETGLDFYYDKSDRDRQADTFRTHIRAAQTTGLPLIVHTRDAEDATISLLRHAFNDRPVTGVIHCFTGSQALADKALELGFYISFSGIVTFKNAQNLRDTAKTIPVDRILIETDSPFLAPVPYRGRACEPAFVTETARCLAGLRECAIEDLAAQTSRNFYALFSKARG